MQAFAVLALAAVAAAQESYAVSQIADGQIQAPSAAPASPPVVTQIGDGQIQAPTGTAPAPAPPAPSAPTGSVVPPAQNTTVPTAPVSPSGTPIAEGAAALFGWSASLAGAAGVAALAALL